MRKNSIAKAIAAAVMLGALAAQPVVYGAPQGGEDAVLNFVGADIESVIKAVGHFTGTTFIVDPRVKGTLTLVSEKRVSKQQAFNLLASALRLQGYAVVTTDGLTKVVPEADAKLQAAPVQAGVKGDQIVTQIFRLNYESAANMTTVLRPLISPNNTINANPGNNSIVITDYADNMARLGKIIAALDAPASSDLDVVTIRYAIASDIATMVNRLLDSSGPEARTTLLADSRTNSVIVRAPSVARANLAKSLIAKLDQPTALPGNVHVVYLKNADAIKLAQTLRAVVAMDTALPTSPGSGTTGATTSTSSTIGATQPTAAAPSPAATPSLATGGAGGFIQADPSTNTLIITASEPVYRNLRAVIDQLDARRAQVYVESLIVEVTAAKAAELGIQWAGLSGDAESKYRVGGLTSFSTSGNNLINLVAGAGSVAPGNGLSIGVFKQDNGKLTLGAVAHALETDGGTNILSMPNLITLDNEEAKIIVGQNVPFITGQYSNGNPGGSATVNPFQTIERKDVGLSLRVRPQISEGGTVKMAIYQETSAVQDTTNAAGIITSKRSIETNVLVDDGQIVVLGGLIEDSINDGQEKVPGLGDIPVVGNLFKYRTRKQGKTNLMVFLRPTVIRSIEQSVNVTSDRYDYIRAAEAAKPAGAPLMQDIAPPMLPQLQNGKPVGGSMLKPEASNPGAPAPGN